MFLLVPAHAGFPGQIPQSHKTVVCVCVITLSGLANKLRCHVKIRLQYQEIYCCFSNTGVNSDTFLTMLELR